MAVQTLFVKNRAMHCLLNEIDEEQARTLLEEPGFKEAWSFVIHSVELKQKALEVANQLALDIDDSQVISEVFKSRESLLLEGTRSFIKEFLTQIMGSILGLNREELNEKKLALQWVEEVARDLVKQRQNILLKPQVEQALAEEKITDIIQEAVDSEIIQYGDKEFSIKKLDARGDVMPVLVDFAHGKPMFVIHTDHHDRQAGAEETGSTSFRPSRSNVETISQIVSPKDIFPETDLRLISTVDSADYAKYDITPEQVINYLFKMDKDSSLQKNKFAMGLVLNKLLLAFKNKPKFLENLVMNSEPSLYSILNQIKKEMGERRLPNPEQLQKNAKDYMKTMETSPNVKTVGNIIVQYGGGSMMNPGSYDRYTPFKNNPDADFLVIAWPLGLLQASCNPFKKERQLKGVNLGEIAQEVLAKHEEKMKNTTIPLSTIKWISEGKITPESVGFTFKDFKALYGDKFSSSEQGKQFLDKLETLMNKPTNQLTDEEFSILDKFGVNAWDLIQANSGGHKCITNISGINYLARSKRPPQGPPKYGQREDDAPYVQALKRLQNEFVEKLQEKINAST